MPAETLLSSGLVAELGPPGNLGTHIQGTRMQGSRSRGLDLR